jgi:hypothetical protein
MAAISGLNGLISLNGTSAVATCRNWNINPTNAVVAGAASNTGGAEFNLRGVSDFSGTFELYGPSALGIVVPGTAYVFYGQGGDEVQAGIIIDSVTTTCDIEGGGVLSASVAFSSIGSSTAVYTANNNALLYQSATSVTNTSLPSIQSGIGCKAAWGPVTQSMADLPAVRNWSLTLTCNNVSFSHSGAGGVTKRVRGRKSASASVQFYEGAFGTFDVAATNYQQGTVGELRLYTDATLYWQVKWGVVTASPIDVPIEDPGMISNQMDFAWTAFTDISGTMTRGTIVDPNSVAYFS